MFNRYNLAYAEKYNRHVPQQWLPMVRQCRTLISLNIRRNRSFAKIVFVQKSFSRVALDKIVFVQINMRTLFFLGTTTFITFFRNTRSALEHKCIVYYFYTRSFLLYILTFLSTSNIGMSVMYN